MSFFFGTPFPNFTVNNDRVLDNLRVRQPNTFKCPPATKDLINPNIPNPDKPDEQIGSNDPATNPTLRSGVAQAGALVYATEPIINSAGAGNPPTDGCFDGRNHLYFSDGNNWIPLANCLPSSTPSSGGGNGNHCGGTFEIKTSVDLTAADSGKTAFIDFSGPGQITLPSIINPNVNGLCFKFIIQSEPDIASSIALQNHDGGERFVGTINKYEAGAGASTAAPVDDRIQIADGEEADSSGDWVEVLSFDGKWYVTGQSSVDGLYFTSV